MTTGRKTKAITFDIKDRGRTYTGQDRSNVDVKSMIDKINSKETQEMVKTGSLIGYWGHQIRQRFGMFPPETAIVDGKLIRLEASAKTIELSATKDGLVTHRQEFFANEAGEFAMKQYQANAAAFSTAARYKEQMGKLFTTLVGGFDLVWQPNFVANAGDGQLFDGLFIPESEEGGIPIFDSMTAVETLNPVSAMLAQALERQILQGYDSIHAQTQLNQHAEQAYDQLAGVMQDNIRLRDRTAKHAIIRRAREKEKYDSMVGETRSFDAVMAEASQFTIAEEERIRNEYDSIAENASKSVVVDVFGSAFNKWIKW